MPKFKATLTTFEGGTVREHHATFEAESFEQAQRDAPKHLPEPSGSYDLIVKELAASA